MRKNCVEKAATKPWWHYHPVLAPFRPVVLPVPGKESRGDIKVWNLSALADNFPSFIRLFQGFG
jgi:hypothetical protein